MADVQHRPPEGRYGRMSGGAGAGTDRGLKIVGAVLGAVFLGVVVWFGAAYISGTQVSGSLIKYKVVSDEAVEVHLEIRKDADVTAVCTLRALEETHGVVGRKDVRIGGGEDRVDTVVTVRTTGRATGAELMSCEAVGGR